MRKVSWVVEESGGVCTCAEECSEDPLWRSAWGGADGPHNFHAHQEGRGCRRLKGVVPSSFLSAFIHTLYVSSLKLLHLGLQGIRHTTALGKSSQAAACDLGQYKDPSVLSVRRYHL